MIYKIEKNYTFLWTFFGKCGFSLFSQLSSVIKKYNSYEKYFLYLKQKENYEKHFCIIILILEAISKL